MGSFGIDPSTCIKPTVARFIVGATFFFSHAGASAQPVDEIAATRIVCESGPSAQLARAERLAGAAQVIAAGVLPNPSLVVQHQRVLAGAADNETIIGVSVPLGIGGRRSLLQSAAAARTEEASANASASMLEGAIGFRAAYAQAVLDQARVVVFERQQESLEKLSATIAGLAKGGEAAEYDLLRQRLHARLHQRLVASAKARAAASLAWVRAWLGAEVSLPVVPLQELVGGARVAEPLFDAGLAHHPALLSLEASARASALDARAARRRWVPELEIFAGYRAATITDDTGHGIALSLSVPLTFFDHGQGEAAVADAEQSLALAKAASSKLQYDAQLRSASARLQLLSENVVELEAASADAVALQQKAEQLYTAGEASITELLEAFRAAEEAQLGQVDAAEEVAAARLERMRAAGRQFDPTLDKACGGTAESKP
jgi:cobalt-zinc-cadmium efflux system outer membrane protein